MQFTVTAAELLNAASKCRATNAQIQAQISAMQNYVIGLMAIYSGPTAVTLQQLADQWGMDSKTLNHVLSTIADGLTSNAHNYVSHETVNAGNLASIAAGLPAARI